MPDPSATGGSKNWAERSKVDGEEEEVKGDGGFGGDISSIDMAPMGDDQLKQAQMSDFLGNDESV